MCACPLEEVEVARWWCRLWCRLRELDTWWLGKEAPGKDNNLPILVATNVSSWCVPLTVQGAHVSVGQDGLCVAAVGGGAVAKEGRRLSLHRHRDGGDPIGVEDRAPVQPGVVEGGGGGGADVERLVQAAANVVLLAAVDHEAGNRGFR